MAHGHDLVKGEFDLSNHDFVMGVLSAGGGW